jgi:hypothetical protein
MAAFETPNLRFALESGAAVARFRFITVNTAGKGVQASASTQYVVGVAQQPVTQADRVLEIYDGIVMVEAGAAVPLLTGGTPVMVNASGQAIPYVSGAGVLVAGIALTAAGASGELIAVKI